VCDLETSRIGAPYIYIYIYMTLVALELMYTSSQIRNCGFKNIALVLSFVFPLDVRM